MQICPPSLATGTAGSRSRTSRILAGGFTLVESVLALGIIAVVFTSLCGVLPVAFGSYRDAMDATYRANMVKKISAELEQAPFDALTTETTTQYFGDQGVQLEEEDREQARFRVESTPSAAADIFTNQNSFLKPVTLSIFNAQSSSSTPLSKVTIFIADNGSRSAAPPAQD